MSRAEDPADPRYVAFISYSHVDGAIARWLHRGIESYRIPRRLRPRSESAVGRERLTPVFLDREELPTSSDLAETVRTALRQSEFCIVVCSPDAARSRWVNEEIRFFKEMGRNARILCLIAGGEPGAVGKGLAPELECLPPALRYEVVDGQITGRLAAEPLAADVRPGGDGRREALLKIIAGLLDTRLDELRQRDQARRQKRLAAIGVAATVGCVVFAGLAVAALFARNEAERQRELAVQKSLTAERTAEFVVSLFRVSDPSEARGNTITAREILDRGVRQIDEALRDEPRVRAELSTTLGEVYNGLGLYGPAYDLLTKARSVADQDAPAVLHQTISLAEIEFQRGNDARADALLAAADRVAAQIHGVDPRQRARLLLAHGDVAAVREQAGDARRYYTEALAMGESQRLPEVTTRALEGIGLAAYYGGDMPLAEQSFEKALAARIRLSGESHPKVSESLTALGSIAYMRGDSARAEKYWLRSLEADRRILGPKHPDLAATMTNLGRLRVERRQFKGAIEILEEAVELMTAQQSETHDALVFGFSNLALAHMGLGQYDVAEPMFEKALTAAIATRHRLQGPVLTDLADLECRTGRAAAGLQRLAEARPIVAERYPDEPWRTAHVDNVRAYCLAQGGDRTEALRLATESAPLVLAKWPAETLYGHDTLARVARVRALAGARAQSVARMG
jgi:tetratricopeptide (TPR) repeat protein